MLKVCNCFDQYNVLYINDNGKWIRYNGDQFGDSLFDNPEDIEYIKVMTPLQVSLNKKVRKVLDEYRSLPK